MARVLLLIPSATYRAHDFLTAARQLGVEVVIGAEEAHAMSDTMGSRTLELPLGDPPVSAAKIVEHDRLLPLDAVVAVDDQGAVAAAEASLRLGLAHNDPEAVSATRDKVRMRMLLEKSEVPQPAFEVIGADDDAAQIARLCQKLGPPCVIKPISLAASQGVLRVDSPGDAPAVAQRVRAIAASAGAASSLLIEKFVGGPEVAVEAILDDGELRPLAVFDKPEPMDGPAFEESIYVTPSRLSKQDLRAVTEAAAAACRAIGVTRGPVHAELRVSDGRAQVIEVAARTIGGLCSRALSFSTGQSLEQLVLAQALGMPVAAVARDWQASGVLMLPIPRAGVFRGVLRVAEALSVPHVTDLQITVAPGKSVLPVPEGNRYLGFVFARARKPAEVETALKRARSVLEIEIVPDEVA